MHWSFSSKNQTVIESHQALEGNQSIEEADDQETEGMMDTQDGTPRSPVVAKDLDSHASQRTHGQLRESPH